MPATTTTTTRLLLVTGASGNLGRAVVRHLLDTVGIPPAQIVAGSRDPAKLQEFADRGVITRAVDFNNAASVVAAAQGVDRALLVSSGDLFASRVSQHKAAVEAFVAAGVRHVLYTSLQGLDKSIALVADDHRQTEAIIRDSKLQGYTILRNGLYFENSIGSIAGATKSGQWYTAAKDGKVSLIGRDDLARAAAIALARGQDTDRKIYELTGPEALTIDTIVAQVNSALGRSGSNAIQIVHVSAEGLAQGIAAATGLPLPVANVLASFDASTAAGLAGDITSDYKQLTGVEPQTHGEWVTAVTGLLRSL